MPTLSPPKRTATKLPNTLTDVAARVAPSTASFILKEFDPQVDRTGMRTRPFTEEVRSRLRRVRNIHLNVPNVTQAETDRRLSEVFEFPDRADLEPMVFDDETA